MNLYKLLDEILADEIIGIAHGCGETAPKYLVKFVDGDYIFPHYFKVVVGYLKVWSIIPVSFKLELGDRVGVMPCVHIPLIEDMSVSIYCGRVYQGNTFLNFPPELGIIRNGILVEEPYILHGKNSVLDPQIRVVWGYDEELDFDMTIHNTELDFSNFPAWDLRILAGAIIGIKNRMIKQLQAGEPQMSLGTRLTGMRNGVPGI